MLVKCNESEKLYEAAASAPQIEKTKTTDSPSPVEKSETAADSICQQENDDAALPADEFIAQESALQTQELPKSASTKPTTQPASKTQNGGSKKSAKPQKVPKKKHRSSRADVNKAFDSAHVLLNEYLQAGRLPETQQEFVKEVNYRATTNVSEDVLFANEKIRVRFNGLVADLKKKR
ncbi:MAG: hypothetical protein ACRCUY_06990 [Thermoguttaceae bacterium]